MYSKGIKALGEVSRKLHVCRTPSKEGNLQAPHQQQRQRLYTTRAQHESQRRSRASAHESQMRIRASRHSKCVSVFPRHRGKGGQRVRINSRENNSYLNMSTLKVKRELNSAVRGFFAAKIQPFSLFFLFFLFVCESFFSTRLSETLACC